MHSLILWKACCHHPATQETHAPNKLKSYYSVFNLPFLSKVWQGRAAPAKEHFSGHSRPELFPSAYCKNHLTRTALLWRVNEIYYWWWICQMCYIPSTMTSFSSTFVLLLVFLAGSSFTDLLHRSCGVEGSQMSYPFFPFIDNCSGKLTYFFF